ncbi:hypothetical protein HZB01_00380 [Candidatus Woesearchaeota archaeon]|nr:hypothetical protein [Candidatus Woesearchaeota archaeon]
MGRTKEQVRDSLMGTLDAGIQVYLSNFRSFFDKNLKGVEGFLEGKKGIVGLAIDIIPIIANLGNSTLREEAEGIHTTLEDLAQEKGFLPFDSDLLTPEEHNRMGSTVWREYQSQPNTPIVLHPKWTPESQHLAGERPGSEQVSRARIVLGHSALNPDGTVVNYDRPSTWDAYMFLSPERKVEVKKLEKYLIQKLDDITIKAYTHRTDILTDFKDAYRGFIEGRIPYNAVKEKEKALKEIPHAGSVEAIDFGEEITTSHKVSSRMGYRDHWLTPQEIAMSGRWFKEKYRANPYAPLALQDGTATLEEVNAFREADLVLRVPGSRFFGEMYKGTEFLLTLEPVTANGTTQRGPVLLETMHDPLNRKPTETTFGIVLTKIL